ncbi:hypothetical protein S7711_03103 [Stachybotrys chartarum IBT 7711]|uniref:cellulase n=1 Tax=Stachybotrys chartarum (strain CBS 109288 / IBT 7711) TaxID=1280523 RepID=A0A084B8C4_STACB|nr:hypothetical protein S7711_03103 [Stachybotrys chartarum IBT 7711]KFA55386.1 hypothetical protein S40293_05689 [Stachybotrys chartarum IBT 40293]
MKTLAFLGVLAGTVSAQATAGPWAQCGGMNWTGATVCTSGHTCSFINDWYSQCIPGTPTTTRVTSSTRTTISTSTRTSSASRTSTTSTTTSSVPAPTGFRWFGVDESVAEFGQGYYPGEYGTHFRFPDEAAISTLIGEGMNTFRISFAMERLSPNGLTGAFDAGYLANLTRTINYVTGRGVYAVLDPHNYGRYRGNIITDVTAFGAWWERLATGFRTNQRVIFDTNNEYHTMDQQLVFNLNQAAIDAIRRVGATSQWIWVEGNQWTGAWSWVDVNDSLKALTDPQNLLVYQMHQYLDSDSSGTHEECVSGTIGVERVRRATQWLRDNNKIGVIGEFAGAANPTCRTAVTGLLAFLRENSDVWTGALWWAAGPWWSDYMYSYEPPSGAAYVYYNSLLRQYAIR